jgi:excinuclease ABC subunit C
MKRGPAGVAIQIFQVRSGRVVERVELGSEEAIVGSSDGEVLEAALQQFYELRVAPPDIDVPSEPDEREALETWLAERAGRRVHIVVPQRGTKRGLVDLASRNAALAYQSRFNQTTAAQYDALEMLQAVLGLQTLPRRIECFDISTFQGSETVASMVVCGDGRMRHGEYRKYRIRGLQPPASSLEPRASRLQPPASKPDDFAAMHEVVLRRYRKLLEQGGPFPDLILIDGGKGQLTAAYEALEALGLANLVAVGLAKKEELLYARDHEDPIALARNDPALLLVQRIRDEAHRFAVTYHRQRRGKAMTRSKLDALAGVGPVRRKRLLAEFGSVAAIKRASVDEIAAVKGMTATLAAQVKSALEGSS